MAPTPIADVLRELLRARSIPSNPTALHQVLKAQGLAVHRHTLAKLLSGETSRPRRSTLELVCRGLRTSALERRSLMSAAANPAPVRAVSILDALGGSTELDRGRELEYFEVRYLVGDADEDDRVVETRETTVGSVGMRLASFGPGQLGRSYFPIEDLPRLEPRLEATRLNQGDAQPIQTFLHVVDLVPEQRQLRFVAQFSDVEPGDIIRWRAEYRWPGLWRSLRLGGQSDGRIGVNRLGRPFVPVASVVVVADARLFPDLELTSLASDDIARRESEVRRGTDKTYHKLTLRVDGTPEQIVFRVSSEQHGGGRRVV